MPWNRSFYVEKEVTGTSAILSPIGEFDLSRAGELQDELQPFLHDSERQLILDFSRLQYIDSTGIGILVSVLKARKEVGVGLEVRHVPPHIKRLFDLTGISPFLEGLA